MRTDRSLSLVCLGAAALCMAPTTQAVDVDAGDWKFSLSGNVNVHYINSQCEDSPSVVAGGLACAAGSGQEDNTSSVSNGLLPAAFVFGVSTNQNGWDIGANLGLYPGISTNDGGSPNLQGQGAALSNTGLGTTGLDVRQVFMTFGNKDIGTFMLGRNFGLFGFDAIINDMTIPGVGVVGAAAGPNPANTTLGSIGYGYIYTDTLAQMNYTTPDLGGLKLTIGIFDPIEPLNAFTGGVTPGPAPAADSSPGFHGKAAFTAGALYLSASFLSQTNDGPNGFDTTAFDVGGKFTAGPLEFLGWFYSGEGIGTTALLFDGSNGLGDERDSDGYLAQVTFKAGDTKFGLNYGVSSLDLTTGDPDSIVDENAKFTVGVYHSLTPNLMLLGEFSDVESEAHNGATNEASNFNVGAFLSF